MTRCVILNASHEPLSVVPAKRGLRLFLDGKATILDCLPDVVFGTVDRTFPVPVRVIMNRYINVGGRYYRHAHLNNHNLKLRDDHTCQYCGRTEKELGRKNELTRDHVIPRSRGGQDVWTNVVAACMSCNHKKDARTPAEAGMALLAEPRNALVSELMLKRDKLGLLGKENVRI